MRLVSAIHVSLALIYTVHAIPVPASLAQEISNPPTVPGSGDRFTTLGDLPTPAALAPHLQRRNDDANPDGSDDDQGNQEGTSASNESQGEEDGEPRQGGRSCIIC